MAPTHRAARRNRRRMWCLGLRLDPKEAAAAAAAAATEASCSRHRRHATVSSAFLRSPPVGARLRARRCTGPMPPASGPVAFQASEPRAERGAWCAERGARRRRLSDARSAERGAPERRVERGARCAAGFRVHPLLLLLLLQARLRFKRPSHARSAERGARRRRPSDARSAERWLVCRVQYECQRASSCALVATGARVC
jgi:hypothetical protein